MFVYSHGIKIRASDSTTSYKAFSTSCWFVKAFSLQKVVKTLEEVVVSWWEIRWIWQNFVAQFVQLLKRWLYDTRSSVVVKNWALSVDHCPLQALQFSVHLINLLSILLRCNVFAEIQKAVVDQTGSRPPNSDHDLFSVASLALGSALELLLSPTTELVFI